jgi:hypothetical protein
MCLVTYERNPRKLYEAALARLWNAEDAYDARKHKADLDEYKALYLEREFARRALDR